jgi:hypothetical protein
VCTIGCTLIATGKGALCNSDDAGVVIKVMGIVMVMVMVNVFGVCW